MICKFYHKKAARCMNGLPLAPPYGKFICSKFPEKCRVFLWKRDAFRENVKPYEGGTIEGSIGAMGKLKTFSDNPVAS